jgi:hypothetical protein
VSVVLCWGVGGGGVQVQGIMIPGGAGGGGMQCVHTVIV